MDRKIGINVREAISTLLNSSALDAHIACAVAHHEPCEGEGPRTALLHVRFKEDEPQVEALAEFLWSQCMLYALPRRRRLEFQEAIKKDISVAARAVQAVRDVFIAFNASSPSRASELGEVLAYCVVQHHLSAAQVAAKMALKTNFNMPIHGLDGIHAAFENGALTIYFLESKLTGSATSGIEDYAQSSSEFLKNRKKYLREYEIVSDLGHFDSLEGEARQAALDFFDVIGRPDLPRRERSVGVICYSEVRHFAAKIPVSEGPVDAHQEHFSQLYRKDHKRLRSAANKYLTNLGANVSKSIIFLVAVPDVNVLRKAFYRAMGVEPHGDDIAASSADDQIDISGAGEDLGDAEPAGSADTCPSR